MSRQTITTPCTMCGEPTNAIIQVSHYRPRDGAPTELRDVRRVALCPECREASPLRDWRAHFEPPFLHTGTHLNLRRCANPACGRQATNIILLDFSDGRGPLSTPSVAHEVFICDQCLEVLYSHLFGAFGYEGEPWTI